MIFCCMDMSHFGDLVLSGFHFCAIGNNTAMNIHLQVVCGRMFSFLPKWEAGSVVTLCLTF